jgi:methionyl-tRNA formyltransferase
MEGGFNQKIKVGYFADGPWSHRTFNLLVNDPTIKIEFIVPRTDSLDCTLFDFSQTYNIPYYKGVKINTIEFYHVAKKHGCDLFVSMSFNQIFKHEIANLPALGTINCHAGKLPFYRGRNILNWAIINDEKEFGITVHFVDEGIDTGDIILQNTFPITEVDTYETLLKVAHEKCASILYLAVKQIQKSDFKRVKQTDIHPVGFYCGQRRPGDEIISWQQTSRQLFNFIRAISSPGPKAHSTVEQSIVTINKASMISDAPIYKGIAGQIVGKTQRGFVVKTTDSTLEIFEIKSEVKLKIGDRLGT